MDALELWWLDMRLLINNEWFDAVSSEGQYESDFEAIVLSHATLLFPDYHAIQFKARVESEVGAKIPDFALIDKQYRHWWVVEVEMAHHSLQGHVLPQVETFATGQYGAEHAEYLATHSTAIERGQANDMIRGAQPRVLVIVNQNTPTWVGPIHRLDGLVTVVEVYRSDRNQHAFRINGDNLTVIPWRQVSACRLDPLLPGLLQIDSPAALEITHGHRISIGFRGGQTEWERTDVSNQVWLSPVGRNPLVKGQDYNILRNPEGTLYLERANQSVGAM